MPQLSSVEDLEKVIDKQQKGLADQYSKLDKLDTALIEMRQKHEDIERRVDRVDAKMGNRGSTWSSLSIADQLMAAPVFAKALTMGRGQRVEVPISAKDILGLGSQQPQALGQIAGGPSLMYQVAGLIPSIATGSGAISFLRETSFTDAAANVAEGAAKPKSDKTFTKIVVPVETIAHYIVVSKQSYEDVSGLAAEIETNLLDGLNRRVEQQILKGTGTSPQLQGIYPIATAATAPTGTPTIIDTLLAAVTQLAIAGYRATGVVLSPQDAGAMAVLKDTTGQYILNATPALPRIVTSPILAAGEWLVGDFSRARIIMREEANVSIATQNEDQFVHNLLTALGEVRLALAVYQPGAFLRNPGAAVMEAETSRRAEVKR